MQDISENVTGGSDIFIQNRSKTRVTGVNDVDTFDDFNISAKTVNGNLIISGENLKISKLDVDCGELLIEGKINSFYYNDEIKENNSLFKRIFK